MVAAILRLGISARKALQDRNWRRVGSLAREMLRRDRRCAEAFFLLGLVNKAERNVDGAIQSFATALSLDGSRYDAAIELASQYVIRVRYADALELTRQYQPVLGGSPRYLDMAARVYTRAGLYESAWPLLVQANALQPGVDMFDANRSECAVAMGRIDDARQIYKSLLARRPTHQRNHYELARLGTATDSAHVEQMIDLLETSGKPPEHNIFLYYAIGKELEDLERWDEAFEYYERGGNAAASVAKYDVADDVRLVDKIIGVCNAAWLADAATDRRRTVDEPGPIFVVGLPRTGTTLVDRVLASHSMIESAGETYFLPLEIWGAAGINDSGYMNPEVLAERATGNMSRIASNYYRNVAHRLRGKPLFVDKLPENVLYLGFILKAFPDAHIVCLERHPMDACFAMYKQSYFRFAYRQEDLGHYYIAYRRLLAHWKRDLGDQVKYIRYEELVTDQERQTRALLQAFGLPFETACLQFHKNESSVNTASSVAVRQPMHANSIARWQRFAGQLAPLREILEAAGIDIGPAAYGQSVTGELPEHGHSF